MMKTGKDILTGFYRRWQRLLYVQLFLYAIGPAFLAWFLTFDLVVSGGIFFLTLLSGMAILRPWDLDLEQVSGYIDQRIGAVEYSTGLLLVPVEQLTGLAGLQQQKISSRLRERISSIRPPAPSHRAGILAGMLLVTGVMLHQFGAVEHLDSRPQSEPEERVVFRPVAPDSVKVRPPVLESQRVKVRYPEYTGVPAATSSEMNIRAVEGSHLAWHIRFDTEVADVAMESMGNEYPMEPVSGGYARTTTVGNSGFYNFRFTDTTGASYVSELYSIEVVRDQAPVVEIHGLDQFTSFTFNQHKQVRFTTVLRDDFGIAGASVIATVSKGTGESVKFREEQLDFDTEIEPGRRNLELSRTIDLDEMDMEPGDELYFYIEASDLREPVSNKTRSETFFAVIKDTLTDQFAMEGSLGVDLMPDYFRSQRQLIIDTEELISNRSDLPEEEFNATSNELGFEQKSLRLKYGQFMGDESQSAIQGGREMPGEETQNQGDPLAEYTHDHDGNNDHNLVEQDHEEHEDKEEDPLAEYLHNHDDPEESTLFTASLKSKLRQALNQMWDAELHLRLYDPEESLPYQYRALDLIQEIKNSARIYVHRIGFDPPPIKEETRLTGEVDEVANFQKREELRLPEQYPSMREAIRRMEEVKATGAAITEADRKLFGQAGNELAGKAVEEPGRFLQTLQQLKWLSETRKEPQERLNRIQRGLLLALPEPEPPLYKDRIFTGDLDELLLKELELNDR